MGRIVCIDYGNRRCGIAVTDPLQIIVNGLTAVETPKLYDFLSQYILVENVEKIVFGLPVHKDGNFTALEPVIRKFASKLKSEFPDVGIDFADEQFSSVDAKDMIMRSGIPQKKRRDKSLTDQVSAVIILQRYLNHI